MAGKDGHKTPALRESLLSEGHRYSFVQAYRLLRLLVLETPSATVGQGEARIAISPFLSSDSPETEVAAISACPTQGEEEYTISAPFPPAFCMKDGATSCIGIANWKRADACSLTAR